MLFVGWTTIVSNELTSKQKSVYDKIMTTVDEDKGGLFFLYGHGGTGKTFIGRLCVLTYDLEEILC